MDYVAAKFQNLSQNKLEILIALLSNFEHNGIVEDRNHLVAYFLSDNFPEIKLNQIALSLQAKLSFESIPEQNWNHSWEHHFKPVIIDGVCGIRASFHPPFSKKEAKYDIIINPKMSFGTGHHTTTSLMVQEMLHLDLKNKSVLDFGCGTGVLSILAEKMDATSILAIDNDNWSLENTIENIKKNHCRHIIVTDTTLGDIKNTFDCILANINRNTLLAHMDKLSQLLNAGQYLLLSGILFEEDTEMIIDTAIAAGVKHLHTRPDNQWAAILFRK